jgi:cellulose synthase/poly-beta-1,6-N-acetylglucosamine synthase-like glycosyltransferase
MTVLAATAWLLAIAVALPVLMLSLECLVGLRPRTRRDPRMESPPIVVLMPAHNEAVGVARSVRSVLEQLRACDRLLVIADNCSDDTAGVATAAGATVVERSDPARRGKSHALAFGREHLQCTDGSRPKSSIIVLVDADCSPGPDAIRQLAWTAWRRNAAVQGAYLLVSPPHADTIVKLSSFAFLIKNLVRQRGLQRLTGAALLQESGMAFPAAMFARLEWDRLSLVEDLDMGIRLVVSGERVLFEERASFVSDASSRAGTGGQRRRWEHGMLRSMGRSVPGLLGAGICGRPRLLLLALDQCVPPAALLIALAAGDTIGVAALVGWHASLQLLLGCDLILGSSLVLVWAKHGREILPGRALLALPSYMAWKLPIAFQFITRRQREWLRTEREP